ncbi:nucleotidyltransferase domain-containing protein [Corynebacterium minutissimum]|uniref:Nucleotidyltransferase domain n=1 Tax=Corynebacterium minutissimum TaxID=38301 RepID=A0A2X4RPI4_9CORY|nr:nucleotidyltransferase domain-containing protein [Corynebacterium minutissimum]KHO28750.1 hypothetical protein NX84_09800 [Corynebacterium minutissimum]QPS59372.1 nucleotidyltransferase domain-containing protein [Corynebacterium minutissimum]QQA79839.1 nucleotidyltransferase domain-containing protein [Corynebacterium minutissimum]SQH99242.1 Nucleotidyltransferase domain [Corynebacterium minutissimum]VEG06505.1 Nucleotidyltransferase domain [Corynebacterium minutissimum]
MWTEREQQILLHNLREELSVPLNILNSVPFLPPEVEAVLVYGSRARGDYVESSDLDLLVLSSIEGTNLNSGKVSVAIYTSEELHRARGTLFGYHLRRDSICIYDPERKLQIEVENFGEVNTGRVFSKARHLGKILSLNEIDLQRYLPGLYREARYLLRSCLYAKAIDEGRPCFSVRILAERYGQPRFATVLSANPADGISSVDYLFCREKLVELVGDLEQNEHGSLEALIVNEWGGEPELISMALMALGDVPNIGDYAEVKAVFL